MTCPVQGKRYGKAAGVELRGRDNEAEVASSLASSMKVLGALGATASKIARGIFR